MDPVIKVEKLSGPDNWAKWKWEMSLHFEQFGLNEIINGTKVCPEATAADYIQWKKDNAKAASLIAGALSNNVANLVLTLTNAKDIWDKLVNVYEQSSVQRLSLLMVEFFQLKRQSDSVAQYVAKVEKLFYDMNSELKKRKVGNEIPVELLHGQILSTIGPEYQEFINVWESLPTEQQITSNLLEKLCTIEKRLASSVPSAESAFVSSKAVSKHVRKKIVCHFCKSTGHIKKNCFKFKQENNGKQVTKPSSNSLVAGAVHPAVTQDWVYDSGASHHMCPNRQWFVNYKHFSEPKDIYVANKDKVFAYGTGDISVETYVNGKWFKFEIKDVYYVPKLSHTLFSVRSSTSNGTEFSIQRDKVLLKKGNRLVGTATWRNGLYYMDMRVIEPKICESVHLATTGDSLQLWHERFGHQNKRHVKTILERLGLQFSGDVSDFCDGCALGKAHIKPFKTRTDRAKVVGEVINADVNGPMSVPGLKGEKYFVLFKDDYSKFRTLYFIKEKSEVFNCMKTFLNEAATAGHTVKALRCDGGKEFDCRQVKQLLNSKGISLLLSTPYCPQQNGAAEREMRTTVELARSMLSVSGLPKKLWVEACEIASYILNRSGKTMIKNKSPIELWFGKTMTDFQHLKVFGTDCYVHIPKQFRKKFDNKSILGKMVGYHNDKDGYKVYIPSKGKVVLSHDVYFKRERVCSTSNEIEIVSVPSENSIVEENETENSVPENDPDVENFDDSLNSEQSEDNQISLQKKESRPKRKIQKPSWMTTGDYKVNDSSSDSDNTLEAVFALLTGDVSSFEEAIVSPQKTKWQAAMKEEINALLENDVWDLVNPPKGQKIIGNRWVFRTKRNADGDIQCFRARLVAKGYVQKAGVDFGEIFSPVARFETIRSVLSVAAKENLQLRQFDVKTAFLYGKLDKIIYMNQPEGFDDGSGRVCRLKGSLYGLRQSPRCWNQRFTDFLKRQELVTSTADPCLFIRNRNGKRLIVAIYVDDGLVAASDQEEVNNFLTELRMNFKCTVSELDTFLGMEIHKDQDNIFICQRTFVRRILERFNMASANPVKTPYDQSGGGKTCNLRSQVPYREAVGSLMYLCIATRPDIAFAVSKAARAVVNPTETDWLRVKRIFKYLRGTENFGLKFADNSVKEGLSAYTDADFGGDETTRRSTSGVLVMHNGAAIAWTSTLQKSVSLSTTEAEFVAASEGAKQLIWNCRLMEELGVNLDKPTLYVDNASAIKLTKNPEFHKRSKHIEIRHYFVRECYQNGYFDVQHIEGKKQIADIFTKPLGPQRFMELRSASGVVRKEEVLDIIPH